MNKSQAQPKRKAKVSKTSTKNKSGINLGVTVSRKLLVLIVTVAALALIILGWWGVRAINVAAQNARLERIESIYASLEIDEDAYRLDAKNVFGSKRVYDYDKDRTYSSSVTYLHGDTVSATAEELDAKIKAAGFEYIDEPYPGSVYKQYHYKSEKGEYIRLTVSSKPYDDAWQNSSLLNKSVPDLADDFDTNQGPSTVIIKVNLDDNNE